MNQAILQVNNLKVYYETSQGPVKAVDGITFNIQAGERFGLVGESGCGKSTTAMALLRLIKPPGVIHAGRVTLDGVDLLGLQAEALRQARWSRMSLIPQGAMNALNPVLHVHSQIAEAITAHTAAASRKELAQRITALLEMVGLPGHVAEMYPHELSGGMKQRVCIAMAIALKPKLIIADEPTSALDVVVQRVVTQTLIRVQEELGAALVVIGHDMGLLAQLADRLAVMYAGKLVEVGAVQGMYVEPLHPYTSVLIGSAPSIKGKKALKSISGLPPNLLHPPPGCVFHPRCPRAMDVCRTEIPTYQEIQPNRFVACHLYQQ